MPRLVACRAVVLRHVAKGVKGQIVLDVDAVRHDVRHHRQVQAEAALQREAQHPRGQAEVRAGRAFWLLSARGSRLLALTRAMSNWPPSARRIW